MRLKKTGLLILIVLLISCTKDTNVANQNIAETISTSFIEELTSLENKDGMVINGTTVTFSKDFILPESLTLNLKEGDRIHVKAGVTLNLNAKINIANSKTPIFHLESGARLMDCTGIDVINADLYADTSLNTRTSEALQIAVDSCPNISLVIASGIYKISEEVQLRVNNRDYNFTNATFEGISDSITVIGGLISIVDRVDSNCSNVNDDCESRPLNNIKINGGTYIPKASSDNSLGIGNAKDVEILNVNIIHSDPNDANVDGQRGIAFQNLNGDYQGEDPVIDNVLIDGVTQIGGVNVINFDIVNGLANNIDIYNITGTDIIGGNQAAFRMSSGGDFQRIMNVNIDTVDLNNVYMGFNLFGVNADISNVIINDVSYRGINIKHPDNISFDNIDIKGSLSTTDMIVGGASSSGGHNHLSFENIELTGDFNRGILTTDPSVQVIFQDLTIIGKMNYGIYNIGHTALFENVYIFNENISIGNKGVYNHDTSTHSTFNSVSVTGKFVHGIYNRATDSKFLKVSVDTFESINSAGIYNHATGNNCIFNADIKGDYLYYGFANAASNTHSTINFTGTNTIGAIHTFGHSSGWVYNSSYNANVRLLDTDSVLINQLRSGDTYELYLYNESTGLYELQ